MQAIIPNRCQARIGDDPDSKMTDGRGQPELSDQQDLGRLLAQIPGWRLLALCRVTRAELSQGSKQSGPNWSIRRSPNITDRLSGRRDGMLVVAAAWKAQPSHKPPATLSERPVILTMG